jgi:hypothetical protein
LRASEEAKLLSCPTLFLAKMLAKWAQ